MLPLIAPHTAIDPRPRENVECPRYSIRCFAAIFSTRSNLKEHMSEPEALTKYQMTWLRRARLLNRLVWAWIVFMIIVAGLTGFGLSMRAADMIVLITSPIPLGFILFVFLNACPRCDKNFYSSSWGGANAFRSTCSHCGLTWKGTRKGVGSLF